jgi:hypothetical protein
VRRASKTEVKTVRAIAAEDDSKPDVRRTVDVTVNYQGSQYKVSLDKSQGYAVTGITRDLRKLLLADFVFVSANRDHDFRFALDISTPVPDHKELLAAFA